MAEENQQTANDNTAQPNGAPEDRGDTADELDYKAQAEEWKANARKWERLAKANAEKAKGYDSAQASAKTVEERVAVLESENRAYREREERAKLVASVAKTTGVSESVVAVLNGANEKVLTEQVKAVAVAFKPASAPNVPEAGQMEHGAGKPTKESILAIKDTKERLRQIALHKDLFERK